MTTSVFAQYESVPMQSMSAAEIKLALRKMQVLGTVLYVAAHPDDENTQMIAYMARQRGMETAYLSLTRGDGGQNLIGKEVTELLGLIRTHELLAARRTDGGYQFFTRAYDFGYSKHPNETLSIWDKDQVLGDVIWTIRKVRPDVIITRFSPYSDGETHGHHTTSAKLILDALGAAGDPIRYPEQLAQYPAWKPKRAVWNTSWWFYRGRKDVDFSKMLKMDIGQYNPLLGKSLGEIAAASRSMHKSQGFGSANRRGEEVEYLTHIVGDSAATDLFEGLDLTWNRVPGSQKVADLLEKANQQYDLEHPEKSVPLLLQILDEMGKLPQDNHYVRLKTKELEEIILNCSGIWMEGVANMYSVAPGDSVKVTAKLIQRNPAQAVLKKVDYGFKTISPDSLLPANRLYTAVDSFVIPKNTALSQPYWLANPRTGAMFTVNDPKLVGLPENPAPLHVTFTVGFANTARLISRTVPVLYSWTDPVDGERYRPLAVTPPITATIEDPVYIYAEQTAKPVNILVKGLSPKVKAEISLEMPKGWKASPEVIPVVFSEKYAEQKITFQVTPPAGESLGQVRVKMKVGNQVYDKGLQLIDYPHIPIQTLFPTAEAKLAKLAIQKAGNRIGYITGAGDNTPEALRQIGYQVDVLTDADMTPEKLQAYDAIIAGVRAYNTNERLKFQQPALLEYVKNGGTMVVQYNTNSRLTTDQVGPFPLSISRDRVTDENSKVTFLQPNHELLSYPNRLSEGDFQGWVQERGLYFPNKWDENYTPIFSMSDPGEKETQGSVLVAKYGKGGYVYTGLSFFRQLPEGVPGAYRLLVNMLSYGKKPPLRVDKK